MAADMMDEDRQAEIEIISRNQALPRLLAKGRDRDRFEEGVKAAPDLFKIFSITLLRLGIRPHGAVRPARPPAQPASAMSTRSLLAALAARIGAAQAEQEYKWMRQAVPREPDLVTMIRRRVLGEPLQYILGTSFTPIYYHILTLSSIHQALSLLARSISLPVPQFSYPGRKQSTG
jgi:hypothetical protein